jgi:hypothetical protein
MYLDEQRTPRRHKLVVAHDAYLRDLLGRRATMLELVQSTAATSAWGAAGGQPRAGRS